MVNHKEILRLKNLGLTHRELADTTGCSHNTVTRTLARAQEQQLSWQRAQSTSQQEVSQNLFPIKTKGSCLQDAGLRVSAPRDAKEWCYFESAAGGIL